MLLLSACVFQTKAQMVIQIGEHQKPLNNKDTLYRNSLRETVRFLKAGRAGQEAGHVFNVMVLTVEKKTGKTKAFWLQDGVLNEFIKEQMGKPETGYIQISQYSTANGVKHPVALRLVLAP